MIWISFGCQGGCRFSIMDTIALTLLVQNQSRYDTVLLLLFQCLYFDYLLPAIWLRVQAEINWTALVPYSNPTKTCTFCNKACLQIALYLYYNCTGTSLKVWDKLYWEPILSPYYRLKNARWVVGTGPDQRIYFCYLPWVPKYALLNGRWTLNCALLIYKAQFRHDWKYHQMHSQKCYNIM